MHREWFETLGGWDSAFNGTFYSHVDLAIRAQKAGSRVVMSNSPLLDCDHSPIEHQVIESTQTNHDKPLYFQRYGNAGWMFRELFIDINNWKDSSSCWDRFNK